MNKIPTPSLVTSVLWYPDSVKTQPQQARSNRTEGISDWNIPTTSGNTLPQPVLLSDRWLQGWKPTALSKRFKAKRIKCCITAVLHYVTFSEPLCSPTLSSCARLMEICSSGVPQMEFGGIPFPHKPSGGRNVSPRAEWACSRTLQDCRRSQAWIRLSSGFMTQL